jgi:hypothetical protein
VTKSHSLNTLCKNLLFLEDRLTYLCIDRLPAASTLSDANINRSSEVFAAIYLELYRHYSESLNPKHCGLIGEKLDVSKVSVFDSFTITLFVDIFKGAGRNTIDGKKKNGLKIHSLVPMGGFVPSLVHLTEAACNDKVFLGQLDVETGGI